MRTVTGSLFGRLSLSLTLCGLLLGCASQISLQRGEELSAAGRWEEAAQFYLDAASKDPKNIEIRLYLARAMQEASQTAVTQGNQLIADGRVDEATSAYRRALRYNAENLAALEGLERVSVYRQAQERLARTRQRMDKGDWRAAQNEVLMALRLDPENAQARELQAQIAAQLRAETPLPKTDGEKAAAELFSTQPVTLRFRDTDIKEVFEVLSRTAGVNIITDESLPAKRVTTFFRDLPVREAFNLILVSNRLFAKRVAPNTVIVIPDNPAKRQQYDELMVQTFYLTDADAKVAVNLLRTILNTRQIFVNEKLNALVVRETPEKIELARKLLAANDRSAAEVVIELEVLEVDWNRLENLGIDIQPRTYSVTLNLPPNIPVTDFWSTITTFSTVSITNPSLILNIAKNDGSTKILANPTVRILDRQKARLLIGQRYPFQISSTASVPTVSGTTPGTTPTGAVTTTETRTEYRETGLKLTLTPTIHLNGEVTVELTFEISAIGPPIIGLGANAAATPPVNTRNLDTFIKVKNGETRLLGGLLQTVDSSANSRIPGLSDIPILGRLFVSGDQQQQRTDVLISLTPRLVKVLDRPEADVELFPSGTADSFGAPVPAVGLPAPVPTVPAPRPTAPPGGAPPGGPAITPPGGPLPGPPRP
jgi:general secretion pathway protein D